MLESWSEQAFDIVQDKTHHRFEHLSVESNRMNAPGDEGVGVKIAHIVGSGIAVGALIVIMLHYMLLIMSMRKLRNSPGTTISFIYPDSTEYGVTNLFYQT
jgi:hypothetical protein